MTSLVSVIDDLERCIMSNYEEDHGVSLILKKMKSEMEKRGLVEIENQLVKVWIQIFMKFTRVYLLKAKKIQGKLLM